MEIAKGYIDCGFCRFSTKNENRNKPQILFIMHLDRMYIDSYRHYILAQKWTQEEISISDKNQKKLDCGFY